MHTGDDRRITEAGKPGTGDGMGRGGNRDGGMDQGWLEWGGDGSRVDGSGAKEQDTKTS